MNETEIADILKSTRTIALVGASDKPERPSYRVMAYLLDQGYHVIPVSPKVAGKTLLGQKGYGSLSEIPEQIDMVDEFRSGLGRGAGSYRHWCQNTLAATWRH